MPETLLTPIMDALRVCLCDTLEASGASPCFCGLYPGPTATADWCSCDGAGGCGMAWVRLDRIYPSGVAFPNPDTSVGNCDAILAAALEVGVNRCLPQPDPRTGEMNPADVVNTAIQQASDAMALFRAAKCCVEITRRPHFLGTYLPTSNGDCGGGILPVIVQLIRR